MPRVHRLSQEGVGPVEGEEGREQACLGPCTRSTFGAPVMSPWSCRDTDGVPEAVARGTDTALPTWMYLQLNNTA